MAVARLEGDLVGEASLRGEGGGALHLEGGEGDPCEKKRKGVSVSLKSALAARAGRNGRGGVEPRRRGGARALDGGAVFLADVAGAAPDAAADVDGGGCARHPSELEHLIDHVDLRRGNAQLELPARAWAASLGRSAASGGSLILSTAGGTMGGWVRRISHSPGPGGGRCASSPPGSSRGGGGRPKCPPTLRGGEPSWTIEFTADARRERRSGWHGRNQERTSDQLNPGARDCALGARRGASERVTWCTHAGWTRHRTWRSPLEASRKARCGLPAARSRSWELWC